MLWAFAKLGVRPDAAWMLDWLAAMQARMDRWGQHMLSWEGGVSCSCQHACVAVRLCASHTCCEAAAASGHMGLAGKSCCV